MTHEHRARRFEVDALARVEGEGGLIVEIRDGEDSGATLQPVIETLGLRAG
mgnify:CR=1 FL=1